MISTPETRAHAQDILDYIDRHPEEHDQSFWIGDYDRLRDDATPETGCGTTMCIAGTSVFLAEGVEGLRKFTDYRSEAGENLGLDNDERMDLFISTANFIEGNAAAIDAVRAIASGDSVKFKEVLENLFDKDPSYM